MGDISAMLEATTPNKKKSNSIFLQIVEHKDGSITKPQVPNSPPTPISTTSKALSKDIPLNSTTNTSLRLYLPNPPPPENTKLPVIVYYHGGGFVLFSPAFVFYHEFCERLAASLPALVLSLDYRLAPDHPLPAAYHDARDALLFAARSDNNSDPWIARFADPSRLFVAGSSSGGNMAYFAALEAPRLNLALRGAVLIQPYFGGEERTGSEAESEEDAVLPLRASDMMWRMALPRGATRDHVYCNPVIIGDGIVMPRTQVLGCRGDPLFDRQKEFVGMLERGGVSVDARMEEDGYHAIELFDPERAEALCAQIKEFVYAAA